MFKVVEYPSSVPTANLESSYIKQNEILNHAKYLHTAFGGVILANIETGNTSCPYILAGSVCLFCETLFYTESNITLTENSSAEGMRFISLTFNIANRTLEAKLETSTDGGFEPQRGQSYYYGSEGIIKKYIGFCMYHKNNQYYSKYYISQEQA